MFKEGYLMSAVLYNKDGGTIICERPDWKNCPEHKHLTTKRPPHNKAMLEDRSKPPFTIRLEEEEGSVTILDTNGDLYWKQYDSYGAGVGSGKISGISKMLYGKRIKQAVAEAWAVHDEQNAIKNKDTIWEGFEDN